MNPLLGLVIGALESGIIVPGPPKLRRFEFGSDEPKRDKPEWMKRAKARHKRRKGQGYTKEK